MHFNLLTPKEWLASNFPQQYPRIKHLGHGKWSSTREALDCETNFPCQHLRKWSYGSMKNMHTVFRWLCKKLIWIFEVILDCVVFAQLCYVINLENLFHLLNRSGTNLKPMATCSFVFSCPALDILIQAFLTWYWGNFPYKGSSLNWSCICSLNVFWPLPISVNRNGAIKLFKQYFLCCRDLKESIHVAWMKHYTP